MTIDDNDNGWDSLAEDLGIEAKPAANAEKHSAPPPAPRPPARPVVARPQLVAEPEPEADDFGTGVVEELPTHAALYDPGPESIADETEGVDDGMNDVLDDDLEGDESLEAGDEASPQEGGKRRRRRRRRKKKDGPEDAAPAPVADVEDDDSVVEEGEAPAPLDEDDDDEEAAPSAMDEEMEAEAAGPRPEWHVMTWLELVAKLHRPG
ncbi:MAG TPA: hypothetical protein VHR66_05445 [Gemmataceae bacterium]|jgi:hypothetical protein|nr:hypothetical protein [Gemmataceae bacterium]